MEPIRTAILTVSDRSSRGERPDLSGPALLEAVLANGWVAVQTRIVADAIEQIRAVLLAWCSSAEVDVIFTTGGTGFAPRDVTPEATQSIIERSAPGLAEAMRGSSLLVTPHAMLSRATAGIRGRTLIINLPGSPKAAVENLQVVAPVIPHAVQLLREDPRAEQSHTRVDEA